MVASNIIPLGEAKTYLSLDDTSRDTEVIRMVKSAISWVEKRTQHIMVAKDKVYDVEDCKVNVYDFPIVTKPIEVDSEKVKSTYSIMNVSTAETITIGLGYNDIDDVPEDLIEACYLMLKFFFYEQEGKGNIPESIYQITDSYRRFVV